MSKILVFQHVPYEHLGQFELPFREQGFECNYIRSFEKDLSTFEWEKQEDLSGGVILGGPMSANQQDQYPFIKEELRLIEGGLKREIPLLGICLGSQMIAKVLGARVYRGNQKEIGWYPLRLTSDATSDQVLGEWPAPLTLFQWHGETFDLPSGTTHLAASELYPHQAYRFGKNVYGFQFHPEMTEAMIREWLEINREEVASARLPRDKEGILSDMKVFLPQLPPLAKSLARGWGNLLRA